MKIAVMGAGAVGCYYGFNLARAGHDVVLIGRPQHVEAIERQGLRLETQTFDERIRVSASTEGSTVQGAQLVLFSVNSTDTESGAAGHQAASCARCVGAFVTKRRCRLETVKNDRVGPDLRVTWAPRQRRETR